MNKHLNTIEIIAAISGEVEKIDAEKIKHLKNCTQCAGQISMQKKVHSLLFGITPKKSPANIRQDVLHKLSDISIFLKPNTDWVFLISLILLFTLGFGIIFYGDISLFPPDIILNFKQNFPQINPQNLFSFLPGLFKQNLNFSSKYIYLFCGLTSILAYILLDKKLIKIFKFNKS
jgi:hypothetical protein